ncbi:serine hydrolase domain-containing protein [Microbacterium deminutum]|uniref:Serine hydrolase domain-containing protein n=1 Tax=Microbacterium deminutum TaxID=344164 RepID=A0ABN2QNU9_9MICO
MPAQPRRLRAAAAVLAALGMLLSLAGCAVERRVDVGPLAQSDAAFSDETVTQLKDAVDFAMAVSGSSGAVVGVWAPWSGSWVAGIGTQSPGGAAVTADMQFRAGKITRAMTCDILFSVADEGTVRLDDNVSKYVPGVPEATGVTLQELCDGTSGIGSFSRQLRPLWLTNPTRVWDPRELASYGLGQRRAFKAGARYGDSDAGYVLLGLALERATGRSAQDLIAQYVTDPLNLTGTQLPAPSVATLVTTGPVLRGYQTLKGKDGYNCAKPLDITSLSASVGFTDAGVVSTIADLGRYGRALATGALLPKGTDRFAHPLAANASAPAWYTATGGTIQAGSLIGQFGAVPGYLSAVFSDRESGLTVALVLNNSAASGDVAGDLAWQLAAIASKTPAAAGQTAPEAGLPWTAGQYHDLIAKSAVCPLPAK